jgi:hypothetical protein
MTKIYIFDEINIFNSNNKESIAFLINFIILYLYGSLMIYIFSNFYGLLFNFLKTRSSFYYYKIIIFLLFNLFKMYY